MAAVEVPDLLPPVGRCLRAVRGPVYREEGMPGARVDVELVLLPGLGQRLVQLGDLVRRGVLVIRAEEAEQRAGQVLAQVHDRADLERHALGRRADNERAVTVDGGIQRQAAGGQEDRKSTRLNSSHVKISYAVFCLKKKKKPYYLYSIQKKKKKKKKTQ